MTALILLAIQGGMGAFDTLYYHEYKLKLPHAVHAKYELLLHALRDFAYALIFLSIGWVQWAGVLAWVFAAVLVFEIVVTLLDFVEEDRIRKLPAGERVMHALMGIVYGLFLAFMVPVLWQWSHLATGFMGVSYGAMSWLLTLAGVGVLLSGVRDLSFSLKPAG